MSDTLNITPPEPETGSPPPFIQLANTLSSTLTWKSGLLGKLLTFVDASYSDRDQREAVKSIIKGIVHDHYRNTTDDLDRILNQFTDVFEGEVVEYTKMMTLGGEIDQRNSTTIIYDPPFTKK